MKLHELHHLCLVGYRELITSSTIATPGRPIGGRSGGPGNGRSCRPGSGCNSGPSSGRSSGPSSRRSTRSKCIGGCVRHRKWERLGLCLKTVRGGRGCQFITSSTICSAHDQVPSTSFARLGSEIARSVLHVFIREYNRRCSSRVQQIEQTHYKLTQTAKIGTL